MTSTHSDRFGLETPLAEAASVIKSHAQLLTSFRSSLAEFGEEHKASHKTVRDLAQDIGRMGERLAENIKAFQQVKEAIQGLSESLQSVREAVMRNAHHRTVRRLARVEWDTRGRTLASCQTG